MRPFAYSRPANAVDAVRAAGANTMYHAGGTTPVDLMILDLWRPDGLIDITAFPDTRFHDVVREGSSLRIGAMITMAELAGNEDGRAACPMLTESLCLAASAQIRNMARLGGNVLQVTRCSYYRDTS